MCDPAIDSDIRLEQCLEIGLPTPNAKITPHLERWKRPAGYISFNNDVPTYSVERCLPSRRASPFIKGAFFLSAPVVTLKRLGLIFVHS